MATIWVAEHLTLGTKVAVKMISTTAMRDETTRERFLREARIMARLAGQHVPRVLDFVEAPSSERSDRPFVVMELLEGEDLASRILRTKALSPAQTADIIDDLASALSVAHAQGIIHRDVKPDNVFLTAAPEREVAKLLDFGIAKDPTATSDLTLADATMGTPHYMSPEQIVSSRDVDARCDVWALAVVAYVSLTGYTPFDADTYGAVCIAIHQGKFDPPSTHVPDLSGAIDDFFARALHPRIEVRFQTADALARAFREATTAPSPLAYDEVVALEGLLRTAHPAHEENIAFDLSRPIRAMSP